METSNSGLDQWSPELPPSVKEDPSGREGASQLLGLRSPPARRGAQPREGRGASPTAARRSARGGAALGHQRHPSSRTSPAFPHPAGRGRGRRRARATAPSPPREPCPTSPSAVQPARPPPPASRVLGTGRRGPWARRQLCGRWGRGSSWCECECACHRRPPEGSSGKGDEEKGSLGVRWPRRQRPLAEPAREISTPAGLRPGRVRSAQQPPSRRQRDRLWGCDSFCLPRWRQQPLPTEEQRPRRQQQHPSPGGTPERRRRRLEQEGKVAAPAGGAFLGARPPPLALPRAPGAGF